MRVLSTSREGPNLIAQVQVSLQGIDTWLFGLYDWGSYDTSVRALYDPTAVGNISIEQQINHLQTEIHQTEAHAKPNTPSRVPPGKYAHLGYLYTMSGDKASAKNCFDAEKTLYPESAVFIDGLLLYLVVIYQKEGRSTSLEFRDFG